ncbi:hypothetical protein HOM50_01660 [bacterium]|jgi:prolyl-tRNA editing enzyme YbaK/EbsC (Cys-tRNA(Pro) deacylase)|nr:hypothetical protein [bacterium]MBT5015093.1 hypothetical protein [bacterium]
MNVYEQKLKQYLTDNNIEFEHLSFKQSCHSVADAANAADASTDDFVKNICMVDKDCNFIVAIVHGNDRASTSRVAKVLGIERPNTATPEQILERTGFPCGGTPSFGFDAIFLIDEKLQDRDVVYTGGGSENSLTKITIPELCKANLGKFVRVRK